MPSSGRNLLLFMGVILFVVFFIRGRYDNKVLAHNPACIHDSLNSAKHAHALIHFPHIN